MIVKDRVQRIHGRPCESTGCCPAEHFIENDAEREEISYADAVCVTSDLLRRHVEECVPRYLTWDTETLTFEPFCHAGWQW